MIISGGVNIYPQEIENVLIAHPRVMDVAVFGAPDDEMGEKVVAVVQPVDFDAAGPALADELLAFAREQLSHVKVPRLIEFTRELPRHPNGKLYKRLLRDEYWGKQSRSSELTLGDSRAVDSEAQIRQLLLRDAADARSLPRPARPASAPHRRAPASPAARSGRLPSTSTGVTWTSRSGTGARFCTTTSSRPWPSNWPAAAT